MKTYLDSKIWFLWKNGFKRHNLKVTKQPDWKCRQNTKFVLSRIPEENGWGSTWVVVHYMTILEIKISIGPNYLASSVTRHLFFFKRKRDREGGTKSRSRGRWHRRGMDLRCTHLIAADTYTKKERKKGRRKKKFRHYSLASYVTSRHGVERKWLPSLNNVFKSFLDEQTIWGGGLGA